MAKKKWQEAANEACSALREVRHVDDVFDALILDVNFANHRLGGIWIYSKLLIAGLRGKFRHLLIWTRYSTQKESVEYQAVDIFRELSFVPPHNVVTADRRGRPGTFRSRVWNLAVASGRRKTKLVREPSQSGSKYRRAAWDWRRDFSCPMACPSRRAAF